MPRSVPEWIGKHPDSQPPPRVRLRILESTGRICWKSGRPIRQGDKWEAHHKKDLWLGGENRESNMAPVLVEPHKELSKAGRAAKKKNDRIIKKAFGISKPKHPLSHPHLRRKMNGDVVDKRTGRIVSRR